MLWHADVLSMNALYRAVFAIHPVCRGGLESHLVQLPAGETFTEAVDVRE